MYSVCSCPGNTTPFSIKTWLLRSLVRLGTHVPKCVYVCGLCVVCVFVCVMHVCVCVFTGFVYVCVWMRCVCSVYECGPLYHF